jgi:hypothetical protein
MKQYKNDLDSFASIAFRRVASVMIEAKERMPEHFGNGGKS